MGGSVSSVNVTFFSIRDFQPRPLARPGQSQLADWNNTTTAERRPSRRCIVEDQSQIRANTPEGIGFGSQGVGGNTMHRRRLSRRSWTQHAIPAAPLVYRSLPKAAPPILAREGGLSRSVLLGNVPRAREYTVVERSDGTEVRRNSNTPHCVPPGELCHTHPTAQFKSTHRWNIHQAHTCRTRSKLQSHMFLPIIWFVRRRSPRIAQRN